MLLLLLPFSLVLHWFSILCSIFIFNSAPHYANCLRRSSFRPNNRFTYYCCFFHSRFFLVFLRLTHTPRIWFLARANDHHFGTHGHINTECAVCAVHPLFSIFHWLSSQSNTFWRKKNNTVDIVSLFIYTLPPNERTRWALMSFSTGMFARSLSNDNENNHIENSSNHHILLLQPANTSRSTFTLVAIRFSCLLYRIWILSLFFMVSLTLYLPYWALYFSLRWRSLHLSSSFFSVFHFALICVFLSIFFAHIHTHCLSLSLASLSQGSQIFMAPKTNDDYL